MDSSGTISENARRAIRFARPDHIPMVFRINPACRHHYAKEALEELMSRHPLLFPEPDIDRQSVTPFGGPAAIDALIRAEVETLGSPRGGLTMIYGLYPGVPPENVKALMDALERYATFYG
jgi:hypothetical protein